MIESKLVEYGKPFLLGILYGLAGFGISISVMSLLGFSKELMLIYVDPCAFVVGLSLILFHYRIEIRKLFGRVRKLARKADLS